MPSTFSIALTADLHLNHARGQSANEALIHFLFDHVPDLLVLVGDMAASVSFAPALERFAALPCLKAVTPGNHDLWVPRDHPTDSLHAYQVQLPADAARAGFHYLDHAPLVLPELGLALVGNVNWYDYSWSAERFRLLHPGEEHRLTSKRFTRGRHNDANFVRWPMDDIGFTALVASTLQRHLETALSEVPTCIVATHHPPFYDLAFPRPGPPVELDHFLWDAFGGNATVEGLLTQHAQRIPFAFCGHTHRSLQANLGPIQGHNIGSGYERKRLLWLEWPSGTIQAHDFE